MINRLLQYQNGHVILVLNDFSNDTRITECSLEMCVAATSIVMYVVIGRHLFNVSLTTISNETFSSQAFASEFREDVAELCLRFFTHSDVFGKFKYPTTLLRVARCEQVN